jgi:transposase
MKRKAYRATGVKRVDWEGLSRGREGQAVQVGFDVGKESVLTVARWGDGRFERPWLVKNPGEIGILVDLLASVARERALRLAMEPTGTYGDVLRQALSDVGLPLERVSAKAAHDYAEIFDGVPSQHDGKDAAVVAELAAAGKSTAWPYETPSETEREMAYHVDWMDAQQRQGVMWLGRLKRLACGSAVIQRQAKAVGVATACVLWVHLGDPSSYHCGEAYRKAMGLNLKERSSGMYQGKLKISKRGFGQVRRWLYFAALRLIVAGPVVSAEKGPGRGQGQACRDRGDAEAGVGIVRGGSGGEGV